MVTIDKENLEKAISSIPKNNQPKNEASAPAIDKNDEIWYLKGALNTLAAERNELVKMISNVEMIMKVHIKRLEELGVKIQQE